MDYIYEIDTTNRKSILIKEEYKDGEIVGEYDSDILLKYSFDMCFKRLAYNIN